ncbi:MAG: phosphotransferase enzyme family protein [Pyrinomonadaceae bacterium]
MRLFPAQTTTLSSTAFAQQLLPRYGFGPSASCLFLHKGLNDTYIVRARSRRYYLRVYRAGWRTRAEINEEIAFLNYLHRRGVHVSRPIKRRDGAYIERVQTLEGTRYAVLFTGAPGAKHVQLTARQSALFGQAAGLMHEQADRQRRTYARYEIDLPHLYDEPLAALRPFFQHRPQDLAYIERVGAACTAALAELPRVAPAYGLCHGDLHAGNVHFNDQTGITLFDFDLFGYGWRAYDLAVFLWSRHLAHTQAAERPMRERAWHAFLRAYTRLRPLSQVELDAIPRFGALRHIWLLGLEADMTKIWGSLWLDDKYIDRAVRFLKRWVREYRLSV